MKRPWVINTLLVPAFDLVSNGGGSFQSKSVQQRAGSLWRWPCLPIVRPRSRRQSHVQAGRTLAPQEIGEQQESPARAEIAEDVSFQKCAIIRLYLCSADASCTICANFFEAFLEFREVRSCPINLAAACATPELFVVDFRKRFEPLNYFGLGNLSQRRVA
jgi:hypothetical protein